MIADEEADLNGARIQPRTKTTSLPGRIVRMEKTLLIGGDHCRRLETHDPIKILFPLQKLYGLKKRVTIGIVRLVDERCESPSAPPSGLRQYLDDELPAYLTVTVFDSELDLSHRTHSHHSVKLTN
jgi:hypothetical protein